MDSSGPSLVYTEPRAGKGEERAKQIEGGSSNQYASSRQDAMDSPDPSTGGGSRGSSQAQQRSLGHTQEGLEGLGRGTVMSENVSRFVERSLENRKAGLTQFISNSILTSSHISRLPEYNYNNKLGTQNFTKSYYLRTCNLIYLKLKKVFTFRSILKKFCGNPQGNRAMTAGVPTLLKILFFQI